MLPVCAATQVFCLEINVAVATDFHWTSPRQVVLNLKRRMLILNIDIASSKSNKCEVFEPQ